MYAAARTRALIARPAINRTPLSLRMCAVLCCAVLWLCCAVAVLCCNSCSGRNPLCGSQHGFCWDRARNRCGHLLVSRRSAAHHCGLLGVCGSRGRKRVLPRARDCLGRFVGGNLADSQTSCRHQHGIKHCTQPIHVNCTFVHVRTPFATHFPPWGSFAVNGGCFFFSLN